MVQWLGGSLQEAKPSKIKSILNNNSKLLNGISKLYKNMLEGYLQIYDKTKVGKRLRA